MSGFDRMLSRGGASHAPSAVAALAALLLASSAVDAAPAIRISETNTVPRCVTPERLMSFVRDRNPAVDPRYRDIAHWYKYYGEAWRVRWDYAFFQMVLETNALKFHRDDGEPGDVNAKQNNFAGIGATGGGVPGDRFPDIKTGVHAQIQHLVAYSGERLAAPIAPRTQLRQDDIIEQSRRLRRAVTFSDLAHRWASDRAYGRSIDTVAELFRTGYCSGAAANAAPENLISRSPVPAPQPARRILTEFAPPSGLGGPKPLMLAGPDDLPWTTGATGKQAAVTAQQQAEPQQIPAAEPKPVDAIPKVSPVRTIWSRDGIVPPATLAPKTAETQPVRAPAALAAQPRATPKAVDAAPPAAAPESGADTIALPHFKIGPAGTPAPSKLGGPVDAMPLAPPEAASSGAHFKEIVTQQPKQIAPAPGGACRVMAASYGGTKTLLVRASVNGETRYTALTVLDGFEKSMFDTFSKAEAPGAEIVGEYPTKAAALADARANCSGG
jgi:hypothetical protein